MQSEYLTPVWYIKINKQSKTHDFNIAYNTFA